MKRLLLILTLIVPLGRLHAQLSNPDLQALVDAERSFIEMAKTQNRRDAFLFYLSDSAITQGPNGPIKGKARIQQQTAGDDWLFWEVAYSDIANSGDFGFNTGPWEFRTKKTDEKPVAYGEFNSVWKKQSDGLWKNILDIGISHGPPSEEVVWATTKHPLTSSTKQKSQKEKKNTVGVLETDFLKSVALSQKAAYQKNISSEAHMMVAGHLPFVGEKNLDRYLETLPAIRNSKLLGSETAYSADMGYGYGTADVTVSTEGKTEIKKATFVRIWKKEDGKNWKIVLDVLTY